MKSKNRKKQLIEAFMDPENWGLKLTHISKKTGIPTSTVFENAKRYGDRLELQVKVKSDLEAFGIR